MGIVVNAGLSNVQAPFIMGGTVINQLERQFDTELSKLKVEMKNQQREFEN